MFHLCNSPLSHKRHHPGPVVGEPFPSGDRAPLAVSYDYFDRLCPTKQDLVRETVNAQMSTQNSAAILTETWASTLR